MLFLEILLAADTPSTLPIPSLGAVSVSSGRAGTCPADSSTSAVVHIAWGLTNGGSDAYEIRVLENGALLTTLNSGVASYDKVLLGYTEGSSKFPVINANWTYTVQLVRVADGVVVQQQVSSAWVKVYGSC